MGNTLGNLFAGAICSSDGHQLVRKSDPCDESLVMLVCDRCGHLDWREIHARLDAMQTSLSQGREEERRRLSGAARILSDLDRCPHGRHLGDNCAGWRGPGRYDGGCVGGFSLGNPFLIAGRTTIGYDMRGRYITIPEDRTARAEVRGWVDGL